MSIFAKKSYVGLDLGHHTFKAMQIEKVGGVWKIVRAGSIRTPENCVKEGVIVDSVTATEAIKTLLREARINATTAHIAVAGGSVIVRSVRIPKMPESTLRKSIKFEATRYVPSSVEDSYIEFEIVGDVGDNQMEVLVVAAPRDIVESRVKACEDAGLEVEAVDVESFATYRSIVEADAFKDWAAETVAIVDIGATMTNISVIQSGLFAMTRSIPNGGKTLTDALMSYFKLSEEDAEAGKAQLDISALKEKDVPIENPPVRVLQPHVDDLVREMRRSLNYHQSQQAEGTAGKQVGLIVLTGGGARLTGMAEYVEHKLGIKTITLGIHDNPSFTQAQPTPDDNALHLSVATGLAMRPYGKAA